MIHEREGDLPVHIYGKVAYISLPAEMVCILFKIDEEKREKRKQEILAGHRACSCLEVPHCQFTDDEIEDMIRSGKLKVLSSRAYLPLAIFMWSTFRERFDIDNWLDQKLKYLLKRYSPDHVGYRSILEGRRVIGAFITLYRHAA